MDPKTGLKKGRYAGVSRCTGVIQGGDIVQPGGCLRKNPKILEGLGFQPIPVADTNILGIDVKVCQRFPIGGGQKESVCSKQGHLGVVRNQSVPIFDGVFGDALLAVVRENFLFEPKLNRITQSVPNGTTDIMAHLYERYLTNTKDVEVTDRLLEALLLTMVHEGPKAVADPNNYEARANIMWAGMIGHNNACGVGRSQDWNSHNIEHELSALYDCAHGAGLAVTMPAVFTYVMNHDVMRFAQIATRVWGCQMDFAHPEETAKAGIEALRNFLISIGMPKNFAELGAKEEDIDKLVEVLCYGDGRTGTIDGFVTLNADDCRKIYQLMV